MSKYNTYAKLLKKAKQRDSDVVKATGISYSTLCDWKASRYTPKVDKLQKIAKHFGVPVTVFLED